MGQHSLERLVLQGSIIEMSVTRESYSASASIGECWRANVGVLGCMRLEAVLPICTILRLVLALHRPASEN
jgi:hypothetical protein